MIKVIYSYGVSPSWGPKFENELRLIEEDSAGKYKIVPLDHRKQLGWKNDVTPWHLDELFRNKDKNLFAFYHHVTELSRNADILFIDQECVYHPDFIKKLSKKIYTVIYSGDDPESSYLRSKPYLYAFDHALCYGVYHNERQKMVEKFLEWGARKANFKPFGCEEHMYNHGLTVEDIKTKERDIEIIFVGGAGSHSRNERLLKIKKVFGSRFKIYGNWGGFKGYLGRIVKGFGSIPIRRLPADDLVPYYNRAKIGINLHLSYGPCNLRLYQLPMNGVMQICDNKKGLGDIYELNKEVVGFDTIGEAIDLIRYYLVHDDERKEIAVNGFLKAKEKYLFRQTFYDIMEEIVPNLIKKKQDQSIT